MGVETEAADNHRVAFPHRSRENKFAAAAEAVSFGGFPRGWWDRCVALEPILSPPPGKVPLL